MKIGIDALPLFGRGGVSRHLADLLPAMLQRGSEHHYRLYARVFRRDRRLRYRVAVQKYEHQALHWHPVWLPDRLMEFAWTRHDLVFPGTKRCLRGLEVFLDTTGLPPAGSPCPIVSVVHDLVPLRFPEWYRAQRDLVRKRLESQVRRASLIIAVSGSTCHDLQSVLGVPAERIRVVHHGIHPRFRRSSNERVEATLQTRGISRPYFLYVGGSGPIKNLDTLLEGFGLFQHSSDEHPLLLLGGDLRWAPDLALELHRFGIGEFVLPIGFIDDAELVDLYSGAMAVVVPSRHESFGFPALEAMACGTPVVAARVGALPEVLGDEALYFDPDRPNELAELLWRMESDDSLRSELSRRGLARASRFTWSRSAEQTLSVLAEASGQGDGSREPSVERGEH